MNAKLVTLLVVLGCLAGLGAGCSSGGGGGGGGASIAPSTSQTAPAGTLALSAPRTTVSVGDTVEVRVSAAQARALYGAGVDLSYDPAVLEWKSAKTGGFIPAATIAAALRSGTPGIVTAGASSEGSAAGVAGSGDVLVLEFTAKAAGSTHLGPVDAVLVDASGSPSTPVVAPLAVTVK